MPTDNPKISAYVPQALYDRFKQFQNEQQLSMSQAVIVLLAEYFGLEQSIKDMDHCATVGNITLPRIEAIERQLFDLSSEIKTFKSTRKTTSNLPVKGVQSNLPLNYQNDIPSNLIAYQLAKRLSVSARSITNRARYPERFPDWSQSEDPDHIAWQVHKDSEPNTYSPVDQTSADQLDKLRDWIQQNS